MALSTTTTTPTGWAADAAYANYQKAQQIAGRPYTPYTGNMLAGANPNQIAGYSGLSTLGQYGQGALGAGQAAAQAASGYQAPQVAAGWAATPQGTAMNTGAASAGPAALGQAFGTAAASAGPAAQMTAAQAELAQMQAAQMNRGVVRDVASKNFTDYDINQYLNPYTNTVVNNAMADLSRQNDITNNATNARAAAAGAFGGSRQAVANTLNNENYLRESGNLSGNLRNQAFNTAAGLIQQDAGRDLTAQGMNQTMDWNVGSLNTNNQQQASLQNMLQANNMSQFNAGNRQAASQYNAGNRQQMAQYNASNQQSAYNQTADALNARETVNQNALNNMAQYNAGNQQSAYNSTAAAHNAMTQANMSAQQSANQYNADLALRAQLANQSAGQNAINTNLSAANALNGMGLDQQRWALNNANGQLTAGNAMQQQEQAALTNQYNQWLESQGYDRNQLDYLRGVLGNYSSGSANSSPYYANTAANVLAGGLGTAQLASMLPSAISGATAGYNALSGLWSGASQMPNSVLDAGAMSAGDLLSDWASW